jgi:CheY-like chemotaxis protein
MNTNFIIVDDDPVNNMLCPTVIKCVFPEAMIHTFTDPGLALNFIKSTYIMPGASNALLLLDINMPALTGWEFLESFELFDGIIKEHLKIYMLSSSIDRYDKERAAKNKNVLGYLEKPLTKENVKSVLYGFNVIRHL